MLLQVLSYDSAAHQYSGRYLITETVMQTLSRFNSQSIAATAFFIFDEPRTTSLYAMGKQLNLTATYAYRPDSGDDGVIKVCQRVHGCVAITIDVCHVAMCT